jgi:hypothetical protein
LYNVLILAELEDGYKAMAADEEYEREAMEWCNGLMSGIDDETRLECV